MSKEAKKYLSQFQTDSITGTVGYEQMIELLNGFHKHQSIKDLEEWTHKRIEEHLLESGVDTSNMIGSSYKLGILYLRDELLKELEG